jgi:hypothetical protein
MTETKRKVGRPKGSTTKGETSNILLYLPVDLAQSARELAKKRASSLTGLFEDLLRNELKRIDN